MSSLSGQSPWFKSHLHSYLPYAQPTRAPPMQYRDTLQRDPPRGYAGDPEGGDKGNGEQAQVARGHGAWSNAGEKCADPGPLPAAPLSPVFLRRWVEPRPHQAVQVSLAV